MKCLIEKIQQVLVPVVFHVALALALPSLVAAAALTVTGGSADESAGKAVFTVHVDDAVAGGFSVTVTFSDLSATGGSDYNNASQTLTFLGNAGEDVTLEVPITSDDDVEGTETFTVILSPNNGVSGANATGTITETDTAALSIANVSVDESSGTASFTVGVNNAVKNGFTVTASFADVSTSGSADYDNTTQTLTFTGTAGETHTLTVPIVNDSMVEGTETFTVNLVSNHVKVSGASATGTITETDTASLSIASVSVDESSGTMSFTVGVNNAVKNGFTVAASFADVSTSGSADFNNTTQTLTFTGTASETHTLIVPIVNDSMVEGTETYTVNLAPSHAGVSGASATGTITDTDTASLSIANVSVDESSGTMSFTVGVNNAVKNGFTVAASFADVSTSGSADYNDTTQTLTFTGTAGETHMLTVPIVNDSMVEGTETFTVNLVPSHGSVSGASATGTITESDTASLSIANVSVDESSGTASFTVGVNNAVKNGFTVTASFADVSTSGSADYDNTTQTLTFTGTAGETHTLTVPIVNDSIVEGTETFTVNLVSNHVKVSGASATGTITETDTASLSIANVSVDESSGTASFTVGVNNAVKNGFTVAASFTDVSTSGSADYDNTGQTLTFTGTAGETHTLTVPIVNDSIVEGTETFTVNLVPSHVKVSGASATGTITDNDSATLSIAPATKLEDGGNVVFTVTSSSPIDTSAGISFSVGYTSGTATAGADFDATTTTSGAISGGASSATLAVPLINDNLVEGNEGFTVTLSNVTGPAAGQVTLVGPTATGTVEEDDKAVLSINDVSVYEDAGTAVFTITSDKVVTSAVAVNVDYVTGDVSALNTIDYTSSTGTAAITNGTSTTVSVPLITDSNTIEPDKTFTVTLANPVSSPALLVDTPAKPVGVGTIVNDEYLITVTEESPFGSIATSASAVHDVDDPDSIIVSRGSSWVFDITSTCPYNALTTHNSKGHHISQLLVDGAPVTAAVGQATYSYPFNNVTTNHSIEVLFTSHVDFTSTGSGHIETTLGNVYSGTPNSLEVPANDSLAVKAVPDTGFHISDVTIGKFSLDSDGITAKFDESSVGTPETYTFENLLNTDFTYKVNFALNSFVVEPVSKYPTIFLDSGETAPATTQTVPYNTDVSFYVNLNDTTYAVYGILVDNISYPIPASGGAATYSNFKLTNTSNDYLEVKFTAVMANHRLEVQDYDKSPLSDVPLDAKLRPKPASLMFALDDSGSMDWEITTTASDGLFNGDYYIYSYPSTTRARVYSDNSLEAHGDHDEWKSQFFGINTMFYNPAVTYVPWPTFTGTPSSQLPAVSATDDLAHANIYRPRLHPWHSQDCADAINLANGSTTANLANCQTTTQNTHNFPMDDVFLEFEDNSNAIIVDNTSGSFSKSGNWDTSTATGMYGSNYFYTTAGTAPDVATWTFTPTKTTTYTVWAWWVETSDRKTVPYTINCSSCGGTGTTVNVNQYYAGRKWVSLGDYSFTAGETVSVTLRDTLNRTSSSCADAVKIAPKSDKIQIINAHYFTWSDTDGDGKVNYTDTNTNGQLDPTETVTDTIYLVNLVSPIEYFKVKDNTQPISGSNLERVAASALPSTVKTYAAPTDADAWLKERQNWADWFSYYRKRTLAATGAVARVIDQMEDIEVGIRTINYNSGYGINQSVLPVDVAGEGDQTNVLLEKLYSFQVAAYGTPLRNGLKYIGQYYDDTDTYNGGIGTSPYHAKEDGDECKQVFTVVMTDGYWNGPDPGVGNTDGNNGIPYADGYSNTLADVAMKYFENDLSSMENLVPDGIYNHQHMVTYTVAFGVYGSLNPAAFDFNKNIYPTWPNPGSADKYKIDDMWHAAVNGRGRFMSASRPDELVDSLLDIMNDISTRVGSGASVSVNGDEMYESVSGQTRMFQTTYNSGDWHGDLKAFKVDTTTGEVVTSAPVWSAEDKLAAVLGTNGAGHTSRKIATSDGSLGKPFRWSSLTTLQKSQLAPYFITSTSTPLTGEHVVNYLRGDKTSETTNTTYGTSYREFRPRDAAHPVGDIVNSLARYQDEVLYVGSNDGMLHAFRATDTGGGEELFSYVPNHVFRNLRELADPAYDHRYFVDNTPDTHKMGNTTLLVGGLGKGGKGYYCLDITNVKAGIASEIDLAARVKWEYPTAPSVLLTGNTFTFSSGTGSGGSDVIADTAKGFSATKFAVGQKIAVIGANYANGVNSGTNDGEYTINSIAADGSKIEIDAGSLITGYGNGKTITITKATEDTGLGYSYSKPYFIETNDTSINSGTDLEGWVVIFGNGYSSEEGTANLYILNPLNGNLIRKLETNVGPFNGMSTPTAIDVNNDLRADYVYAGDLLGNMWKFDLTATRSADWQVAFCDNGNAMYHCNASVSGMIPKPLFAGLSNQPITAAPDVTRHQTKTGYLVVYGTGKYLGEPDLSSTDIQSLYGIWDWAPDALDSGYNGTRVDIGSTSPKTATLSNWPEVNASGDPTHTLLQQVVWAEGVLTEDTDGDGILDTNEDTDGDGILDTYSYYRVVSTYEGDWTIEETKKLAPTHHLYYKDINGDGVVNSSDKVPVSNVGWLFDLPSKLDLIGDHQDNDKDGAIDETGERIPGERVTNDTIIRDGKAILISFGVTGTRCNAGAYSFLNERNVNTGGMTSSAVYDLNGDGEVNADDFIYMKAPIDVNKDGKVDANDVIIAFPSDEAHDGRLYNPAILRDTSTTEQKPEEKKYFSTSQGNIIVVTERGERRGLSYWQQME